MIYVVAILVVILPVAWLGSEFQDRRGVRIVLGVLSLSLSFVIAISVGSLQTLNYNAWYGGASSDLISATLVQLDAGEVEKVRSELKVLQEKYRPTYENRADYDDLVRQYVNALGVSEESLRQKSDP
ncbi:MAG: hypothetical protein KDA52_22270 [Planctomycetaceae bacterium]|nr:hypothetical protein [Planctomycetaceae bacterium]